jgi:hypothetical protein
VSADKNFGRRVSDKRLPRRVAHRIAQFARWAVRRLRSDFWGLAGAAILLGSLVLGQVANTRSDHTSREAKTQVARVDGLVKVIQAERVRNVREGCETQNKRNASTKAEFDRAIPALPAATRDFTFRLVDRLAQVRDCDEVVRQQTGQSQTVKP